MKNSFLFFGCPFYSRSTDTGEQVAPTMNILPLAFFVAAKFHFRSPPPGTMPLLRSSSRKLLLSGLNQCKCGMDLSSSTKHSGGLVDCSHLSNRAVFDKPAGIPIRFLLPRQTTLAFPFQHTLKRSLPQLECFSFKFFRPCRLSLSFPTLRTSP